MDIKYADLFSDEDENKNSNNNNINTSHKINHQLVGKKSYRDNQSIQQNNSHNKNPQNRNKNKKKNKFNNNSFDNLNENNNNNKYSIISKNDIEAAKKNVNDIYFLDDKVKINTNSIYDFENPYKSRYQDILGDKKSILKIQEYIYNSHLTNTKINYKVITQIKTINFKTDNKLFQKGKQQKDFNEENYNFGQAMVDAGSMPSMGFWNNRYYYFTKFDQGIQLDYESWYSVTPEEISIYIADFCKGKVVLDAFGGCGGNTIQFSKYCDKVYYNEIDINKVNLCKNNCRIYKCADNIEFLNEDYQKLKNKLTTDIVFLSPPWGGMDYKSTEYYSLKEWVTPDIAEILETTLSISDNLILYLPRNIEIEELFTILFQTFEKLAVKNKRVFDSTIFCDIHILYSANKAKALLIFIGDLFNHVSAKNIKDYLGSFYKRINLRDINEMIEIIKIIGLEEYLELTNKFYAKLKKNIKSKNAEINLSYDKTEFLQLMSYIIRKKMKKDDSFIPHLKLQIKQRFSNSKEDPNDFNNSLIQNILKIYCFLDCQDKQEGEEIDLEENEIKNPYISYKNKINRIDEETYKRLKNKKI